MNLKTQLAHSSNHGGTRNTSAIKYIVIHYTSNDGDTDEANAKYYQRSDLPRKASAHYFCDDDSITQSVKDNVIAYAVGGNKWNDCAQTGGGKLYKIATNTNSISIEMCDAKRDGVVMVTDKTLANVYELTVMLMKKYNVDINHVIRHFDVTGKHCPAYYMDSAKWQQFKDNVMKVYNGGKVTITETPTTPTPAPTPAQESGYKSHKDFVIDVQKALGVTADGIVGPKTFGATVTVSKSKNNRHAVVKAIQKYLIYIGYGFCGAADGIAGAKFDSAIKMYQKNVVKLSNPDGEVTAKGKTWAKLLNYNVSTTNNSTSTSTPKPASTPASTPTSAGYTFNQFVKDVQKALGTAADGIVGPKTFGATVTVSKSKNNRHAVVKPIQKYLNSLGYNCGTADGIAGAKFDAALKAYQKAVVGLQNPDGEITAKGKTWHKLLNY